MMISQKRVAASVHFASKVVVWATWLNEEYDRSPIPTDRLTKADIFDIGEYWSHGGREKSFLVGGRKQGRVGMTNDDERKRAVGSGKRQGRRESE